LARSLCDRKGGKFAMNWGDTATEEAITDAGNEPKKFVPVVIDGKTSLVEKPPKINLSSLDDVRLEMSRVYRDMRGKRIDSQDGTRLVYVLSQIAKVYDLAETTKRVEAIERALSHRPRP
jgi:hypothetical protein